MVMSNVSSRYNRLIYYINSFICGIEYIKVYCFLVVNLQCMICIEKKRFIEMLCTIKVQICHELYFKNCIIKSSTKHSFLINQRVLHARSLPMAILRLHSFIYLHLILLFWETRCMRDQIIELCRHFYVLVSNLGNLYKQKDLSWPLKCQRTFVRN